MKCLETLEASFTAIEELPESIGLLSSLQKLELIWCKKLKNLPNSIQNLTSLGCLNLEGVSCTDLPDPMKNMKLEELSLKCNIGLWLPMILSFTSLRSLSLINEGESLSSTKPFSLSKLSNLRSFTFFNPPSIRVSFPELPLNLEKLRVNGHASVEQLPDLSSFKSLYYLYIDECTSLQSLLLLPPHLEELRVYGCTSLQDVTDLSMLKELRRMTFSMCSLQSISMKQSLLKIGQQRSSSSEIDIPNREIAEWFDILPGLGDNFLGVALWVVYKVVYNGDECAKTIRALITNQTMGTIMKYDINLPHYYIVGEEIHSRVECIRKEDILVKSGDRIEVSFQSFYFIRDRDEKVPYERLKVKNCGAHVIHKVDSSPS